MWASPSVPHTQQHFFCHKEVNTMKIKISPPTSKHLISLTACYLTHNTIYIYIYCAGILRKSIWFSERGKSKWLFIVSWIIVAASNSYMCTEMHARTQARSGGLWAVIRFHITGFMCPYPIRQQSKRWALFGQWKPAKNTCGLIQLLICRHMTK